MQNVKATFMLTFTKKMMILNLQLGWSGITIAFSQTMLVIIMVLQLDSIDEYSAERKE